MSLSAAIDRRGVPEQVAERILGMIRSGNLRPGDRLPTEAQMTIALGISRPALREALKGLTVMGVLTSRQGGRYTVTGLQLADLMLPINALLSLGEVDPQAQYEARIVVEGALARRAAEVAGPEARARILQLARDGLRLTGDPVAFRLLDLQFHQALYAAAGNPILATLAQTLYDMGLEARRAASALPGVIAASVAQHIAIAEAIAAAAPEAALAACTDHLAHIRDTTMTVLEEGRCPTESLSA